MVEHKKTEDTYSYKGWLNSDSFWKRVFAVWGYGLLPPIIIWTLIVVLVMIYDIYFGPL